MKQCLVIDDAAVVRLIARSILADLGYGVHEAANGSEALETCRLGTPDIILLDARLSAMSTKEFLTALRLSSLNKRPYVIYCTTENDRSEISRAMSAGADDVLIKPYDRQSLAAILDQLPATALEHRSRRGRVPQSA